jgi:hypothetical protein
MGYNYQLYIKTLFSPFFLVVGMSTQEKGVGGFKLTTDLALCGVVHSQLSYPLGLFFKLDVMINTIISLTSLSILSFLVWVAIQIYVDLVRVKRRTILLFQ